MKLACIEVAAKCADAFDKLANIGNWEVNRWLRLVWAAICEGRNDDAYYFAMAAIRAYENIHLGCKECLGTRLVNSIEDAEVGWFHADMECTNCPGVFEFPTPVNEVPF